MKLACALVLVALVACRGGGTKTRRTGSAAPVEILNAPQLPDGGAAAASVDEVEPNDGEDVATPLPLGGVARGRLGAESDVDYYRLDVDKAGVLQVTLSGIEGVDLALEMLDGSGASVGKSDRLGPRIKEGIPNAGVSAGRYTLIVRHAPKKKPPKPKTKKGAKAPAPEPEDTRPEPVYELGAQLVPIPLGGEREPDDDRGTANDLVVADNATGYLGWTDDKDVWKLSVETLSEKNALDVQASAIEGVALVLDVTDAVGTVLATRKGMRGQPLTVRGILPVVANGGPPFYYVVVRGDKSNPETAYTLHATARVLGPDAELEPNDNADKAQPIPADRTVVHASWSPGDVDCFALPSAPAARTVEVTIDTPAEIDLAAELLVDGKAIATANKGAKGVVEKLSAVVPAGDQAVIRVKNPDANASVEANYDVSVQDAGGAGDNAP